MHEGGSYWTRSRHLFIDHVRALGDRIREDGNVLVLWATNLEYDLVNVFGADRLPEVKLRFGRSYLVSAKWSGIEFRDTVRHLPAGVEKLGELVGLKKLRRDDSIRYCIRDTTITYRFAVKLRETYRALGVEPRSTLAGTAMALWRERYFDRDLVLPDEDQIELSQEAYHGGRTEAFYIGEAKGVRVIDAASMFPWAMTSAPFPIPWGRSSYTTNPRHLGNTLLHVRCESHLPIPSLPYRSTEGTVYPNGRWTGWYVGEELRHFQAIGGRFTIIEGIEFHERARVFDGYIRDLFKLKNKSRGALRSIYKTLLNALYGKFGQGRQKIVAVPLDQWIKEGRKHEDIARATMGFAVYRVEGHRFPWGNVLWSALTTARARVRLHQELLRLHRAGGARLLYCDTDSVMYTGAERIIYPGKATVPGTFEQRGVYRSGQIIGKKEYMLEVKPGVWDCAVKGVPLDQSSKKDLQRLKRQYLQTGRVEFSRPTRLLEAGRTGRQANVWSLRSKVRHVSYSKRRRKPDGALAPLIVRGRRIIG